MHSLRLPVRSLIVGFTRLVSHSRRLSEQFNTLVFTTSVRAKRVHLIVEHSLEVNWKVFKHLCSLILGLGHKTSAVIRCVINKVYYISILVPVCGRHRSLEIAANNSSDAVYWGVLPGVFLGLGVLSLLPLCASKAVCTIAVDRLIPDE